MGDFNDDPFDSSMVFNAQATRERGDVQRARSAKILQYVPSANYNLWFKASNDRNRLLDGTLYYKKQRQCLRSDFSYQRGF